MRVSVLLLMILAALVSCSPIDYEHRLISRLSRDVFFRRVRTPQFIYGVKGRDNGSTRKQSTPPPVRKGEYICGNKVCKLRPGEIPEGCNGICQYPIA